MLEDKSKQFKVLIDTSTLVSASINSLLLDFKILLKHHHYDKAVPLFDFFKKNIDLQIGIYTKEIETESSNVLAKAVMSELLTLSTEKSGINNYDLLNQGSVVLSEGIRTLEKNKNLLTKVPTNEREVEKEIPKIYAFYFNLASIIKKYDPIEQARNIIKMDGKFKKWSFLRQTRYKQAKEEFPGYRKLKKKLNESIVSRNDVLLLAQAMYLKKGYIIQFGNSSFKMFIASTDYHLVSIRDKEGKNPFIPENIEKEFGIICKWPDFLLSDIKS